MKQNGQWLSHVRTRSNTALCSSTPSGAPAGLLTVTGISVSARRTVNVTSGSSTCTW